jgi:2-dehydro-3-deoxygluconokinase
MTVVTFGELLLRLTTPGFERLFQSPVLNAAFGGSEANVAISLARFGVPSRYVTRLPANPVGDAAVRALAAEGIQVHHVVRGGTRMGIYFVETGAGPRPSAVVDDRQPSAMSAIDAATFDWPRVLDGADWLHVSGITAALGPGPAVCLAAAMDAARGRGLTVSLDLNYRAALWPVSQAAAALQPLARRADVLIAGEDHLEPLLDVPIRHGGRDGDLGACGEAARLVAERYGSSFVALTRRDSRSASYVTFGALLWDHGAGEWHESPRYEVRVVDRLGTGDAFAAGLIYARISGRGAAESLRFAVAAGVLKHTVPGDANRVSVDEVDRLAGGDRSGRVIR